MLGRGNFFLGAGKDREGPDSLLSGMDLWPTKGDENGVEFIA